MSKKISTSISVLLYVMSFIILAYAIWSLIFGIQYIQDGIAQEQIVIEGNVYGLVSYFMQNFFIYMFYALVAFALGLTLQQTVVKKDTVAEVIEPSVEPEVIEKNKKKQKEKNQK